MSDIIRASQIDLTLPSVMEVLACSEEACDSKIEAVFLREFAKVADDGVTIGPQHNCDVGFTTYYLDFLLTRNLDGKKIAIECDGKDFHTVRRDSKRDAAIIRAGIVDQIVRIPGRDIWFRIHDVFQMVGQRAPWLFSERGLTNIENLAARPSKVSERWFNLGEDVHGIYTVQEREYGLHDEFEPEHDFDFDADYKELSTWWEKQPTKLYWAFADTLK